MSLLKIKTNIESNSNILKEIRENISGFADNGAIGGENKFSNILNEPAVGSIRVNDSNNNEEIHLSNGVWIMKDKYNGANRSSKGKFTKFVRSISRAVFGTKVNGKLRFGSKRTKKCTRFRGKASFT